jgi:hypothetical protein
MIKGINKQILEVTNTGSPYFERIVYFVRPEGQALSESELKKEAERFSSNTGKPPKSRRSFKEKLTGALYIALGIGAGCALTVMMTVFLKG